MLIISYYTNTGAARGINSPWMLAVRNFKPQRVTLVLRLVERPHQRAQGHFLGFSPLGRHIPLHVQGHRGAEGLPSSDQGLGKWVPLTSTLHLGLQGPWGMSFPNTGASSQSFLHRLGAGAEKLCGSAWRLTLKIKGPEEVQREANSAFPEWGWAQPVDRPSSHFMEEEHHEPLCSHPRPTSLTVGLQWE